jgi:hypothetical protein
MADVTIVCPTHGRAGRVMTFDAFSQEDVVLSVAKSQVEEYRAAYPDARIDPHSDKIVGLPAKKNHIYGKFGAVFYVDDDVMPMVDLAGGGKVEPRLAVELVHRLADQAEQMGTFLFGFNEDNVPMHFQPQKPFALSGPVSGTCQGLLPESGLWWPDDPRFGPAEDIWLAGLNAFRNRSCLRDLRYAVRDVRGTVGGNAALRSSTMMAEMAKKLVESFGDAIVLKDPSQATLYYWRLKVPW